MALGSMRTKYTGSLLLGMLASACNGQDTPPSPSRPTQAAVVTAVQRMSQTMTSALDPRALPMAAETERASRQPPRLQVEGTGAHAKAEVREDEHHREPHTVRVPGGWAVTWSDRNHTRAFFARLDETGEPVAAPSMVRESHSTEEDIWSPSVAFTGQGYGLAWSDPANGRVRFVRLDLQGRPTGRATIVHEGLEMPVATRVVWTGTDFGIAVAMHTGVYFTRVNREGERLGDGVVLAEGTPVAALEELSATASGFVLAWRDADEGKTEHRVRLTRDGQPLDPTLAQSLRATRIASR